MLRAFTLASVLIVALLPAARTEEPKAIELFNGKDTTGWKFKGDAKRSKWVVGVSTLSVRRGPRRQRRFSD